MDENNKLINDISNFTSNQVIKRKSLKYIAFIKFWAMILIIKWHVIPWKIIKIDYGARMCEILFICSGFLVGYN
jgi:peptidoglycan/LPS O-acetylase OafA/YrhL